MRYWNRVKWPSALLCLLVLLAGCAGDCSSVNDCGGVNIPPLPRLISPSPMPSLDLNQFAFLATPTPTTTPTETPTRTPSNTPTPLATVPFDATSASNELATIQAMANATNAPVLDASGVPVNVEVSVNNAVTDSVIVFGYIKGLFGVDLGNGITPLLYFSLAALLVVIGTKTITTIVPIVFLFVGFIRKIVQLILDFIPL